jgi:hypothetical protein
LNWSGNPLDTDLLSLKTIRFISYPNSQKTKGPGTQISDAQHPHSASHLNILAISQQQESPELTGYGNVLRTDMFQKRIAINELLKRRTMCNKSSIQFATASSPIPTVVVIKTFLQHQACKSQPLFPLYTISSNI